MVTAVLAVALMSSCSTFVAVRTPPPPGASHGRGRSVAVHSLTPVRNNATVRLDAATYYGELEVNANHVTLEGEGNVRTFFEGRLVIRGNGFSARGITFDGAVVVYGNAADFTGSRLRGSVYDHGRANRF